jgi:hypothetical protein
MMSMVELHGLIDCVILRSDPWRSHVKHQTDQAPDGRADKCR